MYDRQMAQDRIDDMIRVADRERLARRTRAARVAGRRSVLRRIGTGVAHAVTWPGRH
jgi:hypothetical protein